MIIEIALGIVLAVIILSLIPLILRVGIVILNIVLVLGLCGLLIHWAINSTSSFLIALIVVGVIIIGVFAALFIAKKTLLTVEEAGGFMIVSLLLGFASISLFEKYQKSSDISQEAQYLLPVLAFLAIINIFIWRRIRDRKSKTQNEV